MTVKTLTFLLLFLCCMGLLPVANAALLPETTVSHKALSSFTINERTVIEADIIDGEGISEARCYFKTNLNSYYLFTPMDRLSENRYRCVLPVLSTAVDSVEYFFLIVNNRGQIIRTTPYLVQDFDNTPTPEKEIVTDPSHIVEVYNELGEPDPVEISAIADTQVRFLPASSSDKLHGLRSGVYQQDIIPDFLKVMPGFFGGFLLNPTEKTIRPVSGFAPYMTSLLQQNSLSGATPFAYETVTTEPVNIEGSNWIGYFYRSDSSYRLYLTASIDQAGSRVSITTTKDGIGHYLEGTINAYGDMLIYDSYDGEDWTTHYGPARYTKVKIYDYAWPPSPEDPVPPLNAIILYRPPLPPSGLTASDGEFPDRVALDWDLSSGAGSYIVYSCSSTSTDDCQMLEHILTNHFDDVRKTEGEVYYRIKACDDLCSEYSSYDTGYLAKHIPMTPILYLLL